MRGFVEHPCSQGGLVQHCCATLLCDTARAACAQLHSCAPGLQRLLCWYLLCWSAMLLVGCSGGPILPKLKGER